MLAVGGILAASIAVALGTRFKDAAETSDPSSPAATVARTVSAP